MSIECLGGLRKATAGGEEEGVTNGNCWGEGILLLMLMGSTSGDRGGVTGATVGSDSGFGVGPCSVVVGTSF